VDVNACSLCVFNPPLFVCLGLPFPSIRTHTQRGVGTAAQQEAEAVA